MVPFINSFYHTSVWAWIPCKQTLQQDLGAIFWEVIKEAMWRGGAARGKEGKPIEGKQMSVLSRWTTGAQSLWRPLRDYTEHASVWKLGFLSINSHLSLVEGPSWAKEPAQAERGRKPQAEWELTAVNLQGGPPACWWGTNSFSWTKAWHLTFSMEIWSRFYYGHLTDKETKETQNYSKIYKLAIGYPGLELVCIWF